jgi:hypothetical protein
MDRSSFRRERRSYGAKHGTSRLDAKGWRGTGRSLPYDLSPRQVTSVALLGLPTNSHPRRSISRLHLEELSPEVPTANRMCSSASLPLSAGILPDDCTVDTSSSQGARVSKASSRTKLARAAQELLESLIEGGPRPLRINLPAMMIPVLGYCQRTCSRTNRS